MDPAGATLTFAYADSTAVVGPLATAAEPHSYDLCARHAQQLTAPKGWEVVRPDSDLDDLGPGADDLEALADAVREAGRIDRSGGDRSDRGDRDRHDRGDRNLQTTGRRGHLRVLRFPPD